MARNDPTCLNCGRPVKSGTFCPVCRPIVSAYARRLLPADTVKRLLKKQIKRGK